MNKYHHCSGNVDLNIVSGFKYTWVTKTDKIYYWSAGRLYTDGIIIKDLPDELITLLTLNGTYIGEVAQTDMSVSLQESFLYDTSN